MTMIAFTDRQRAAVETFRLATRSAKERCRAPALLWLDEGETGEPVAGLFPVSRQTVDNGVERFQLRRGPDRRSHRADAPRRGRPPTALGVIDPVIAAVLDGDPRDRGDHAPVWTAPLLREDLKQVHGIEVARKSVSLALDRLRVRWKRPRHQLALRPRTGRQTTVLFMLDETIVTETAPLYYASGHLGQQVRIPIPGNRAQRVLHGAINVRSGAVALLITAEGTRETHQGFLAMVRAHWRGWNIVLFEDRAAQHTAPDSRAWARVLAIEVRLLPKATPELNARDQLWKHTKRETLGSRATQAIERSARDACPYIIDLSPAERLRKAGVLSGNFWRT